ncbi:unnamed protein product, partial [Allacma fusca]
ELIATGELR